MGTDGKVYYPTSEGATMRGMRAYFKVPEGVTARLILDDATGIDDVTRPNNNDIYDLQGRKVNAMPKKGLYIVRGKKLIIH